MKIRTDFVSNSSSSSFIVISNKNLEKLDFYGQTITVPSSEHGNCEFGWQFKEYYSFGAKLNFCALLITDVKRLSSSIEYYKKYLEDHNISNWEIDYTNRMIKDIVITNNEDDTRTHKVFKALDEVCRAFDLGTPIWLDSNIADFKRHSKTRFTQDSFMEEIPFDFLEFHVIEED
jgi:hypothetical protein